MPPGDVSLSLAVFPVLNFSQDVEILLSFQDPDETFSYVVSVHPILTYYS